MKKLKCTISYDGTRFSGYQIQPNKRTVQSEMEKAIRQIHKGNDIRIYASGRTDTGVHAKGQVVHFESPLHIPIENWKKALNALLPDDIYINKVESVSSNFHAQYSATEKEYRYFVLNSKEPDVFRRNFIYYYPYSLDFNLINEACKKFEGTHDFTSFSSTRSTVKGDKVRTLYEVSFVREKEEIMFILRGNGFLYNMVRIIIGVLLDVGCGRKSVSEIDKMFLHKDRTVVGKTIPPTGLFLWEVKYE